MIELRGIIQTAMLMARCSGLIIGTDDRKGSIRMKKYLLGMFLPLLALSACTQQPSSKPIPLPADFTPFSLPVEWTPTPAEPTPIPGWIIFEGEGVELALPPNFLGGNPIANREQLIEMVRTLGPEYETFIETVEQNPTGMILVALDLESAESIVGITKREIPPEMTLDEYLNGLLGALVEQIPGTLVVDRSVVRREKDTFGRVVLEFVTGEAISRQLTFVVLEGGWVWTVSFASPLDRFEQMLPTFDLSILTFKYLQ
jgi:hypothetical protein